MVSKTRLTIGLAAMLFTASTARPQTLGVKWEELTAGDFIQAIQRSEGACLLPFGIIEKHGPHLPLGTDLLNVRYLAERAAAKEYAVVFPAYYFGQIFEATHEPGVVAYSARRSEEHTSELQSQSNLVCRL